MKVLHLISGGDTGGAKTHVLTLLKKLMDINVQVELLCIMEGVFTQEARELGIPVKVIPQKKRYDVTVLKRIKDYINLNGYDIVHCHGARANYIAMFIRSGVKVPMLTTLHSDYKLDFTDSFYKNIIYTPINYLALKGFNYILTVTKPFKEMMISRGFKEDRLFVVYNGIDFDTVASLVTREEFFNENSIPLEKDKVYIGIAARLQAVKGVTDFVKAAKTVCDKRKDVTFLIAGDGDEREKIRSFIAENHLENRIYMLGHIENIDDFYNAVDINTLSSLSESFPYALLEGARLKKPTIATAVGGIVEMIKDNKTGILIKAQNPHEMSEAMIKLADNEDLRLSLGENFYTDVKNNFSAEKMAQRHKEIYEKIAKENIK